MFGHKEEQGRIIRATSWAELFPSREEEMADYIENLVARVQAEYESNHSLREYRVEHLPAGDLHIFERTYAGYSTTYQKLRSSGNVVVTFVYPKGLSQCHIITPDVGNVAHRFTTADTVLPKRRFVESVDDEEFRELTGTYLPAVLTHGRGKHATKGWEETMFDNEGHLPLRIGHRIYLSFVLEALSRLRQACPQYF